MNKRLNSRVRFERTPLYVKKEPQVLHLLLQRSSFLVATFSVMAFLLGNLVGNRGWYAAFKSVFGQNEIAYTGMQYPLKDVVDYGCWAKFGGDPSSHTFRQVPADCLMPFDPTRQSDLLSVDYAGGYEDFHEHGSHPGLDIRVPEGTPVYAMAAGTVTVVKENSSFGKVIVVEHPNVPDPDRPGQTRTIYSVYAHLSSQLVEEKMVVMKGEKIALSGRTGVATGPHLHWQVDKASAPYHPYWPFTTADMSAAGMSFFTAVSSGLNRTQLLENTLSPALIVQTTPQTVIVRSTPVQTKPVSFKDRAAQRAAKRATTTVAVVTPPKREPVRVVSQQEVVSADVNAIPAPRPAAPAAPPVKVEDVSGVHFSHDGEFTGREWETVSVTLEGADGRDMDTVPANVSVVLRTAYGEAEFDPPTLSAKDFKNGRATVRMLPRGRRTVVLEAKPYSSLSTPLKYAQ